MTFRTLTLPLLLLLLGTGCVGKNKYESALATGAALEQQIADLEGALADERAALADLESQLSSERAHTKELNDLVASLEQRNLQLTDNLRALAGTVSDLQARGRADSDKKAELETMLNALQDESARTTSEVEAARARIAELAAERERLAAEAARLKAEKDKLAAKTKAYDDLVAAMKDEIDAGQVKITELSGRLTVNVSNALFDSGKFALKPEGVEALTKVAGVLAQVTDRTIAVEGHTDDDAVRSGAAYADNWALSSLRASTVVSLLTANGVEPLTIRAVGLGAFHPVESNDTPEGKAANRRTEIVLLPRLN
jgi:chemotaxis protein MotB